MFIIKNEMDEKLKYKSSCKNVLLESIWILYNSLYHGL